MKYREYLDTAKRHLATCQSFFDGIKWEASPKKEDLLKKELSWLKSNETFLKDAISVLETEIVLLKNASKQLLKKGLYLLKVSASSLKKTEREAQLAELERLLEQTTSLLSKANSQLIEIKQLCTQTTGLNTTDLNTLCIKDILQLLKDAVSQLDCKGTLLEHSICQLQNKISDLEDKVLSIKCNKVLLDYNFKRLKEKNNLLKDIYYLTGYIFEAFTVFIIYKTGYEYVKKTNKDFNPDNHHIDEFNKVFTKRMKIDFYPRTYDPKSNEFHTIRKYYNKIRTHETEEDKKKDKLSEPDIAFLDKEMKYLNGINQHHFSKIVDLVIKKKPSLFDNTIPPDCRVPYFKESVSKEVEMLIINWRPTLRYSDASAWEGVDEWLDEFSLKELLDTCQTINKKIGHI